MDILFKYLYIFFENIWFYNNILYQIYYLYI